jgi:23S rRNA (pseudouridine1915-N3)-methyltransferase
MKITLASISVRRSGAKSDATQSLFADYLDRTSRYIPCDSRVFASEAELFQWCDNESGRTRPFLVLLDSRGQQLTSEQFADRLGRLRDSGTQRLILAIGPADGWSAPAIARANLLLSLGLMTLPHEIARVVLAEQLYRAFTILAGHPYHSGH